MNATLTPLLTTAELAAYLKKPVDTVRDWRYQGTGPAYIKVGQAVRYRQDAVEAWLEEQAA